jgi:beta-glucosidase
MKTSFSQSAEDTWPHCVSEIPAHTEIESRIADLLSRMTLEDKVGQMMQAEIRHCTPEDVRKYHLGSVLNGGGSHPEHNKHASAAEWVALADAFYEASMDESDGHIAIPIIWGTDAVHGHNNAVGATIFPHNIGLGATHNPQLLMEIGAATAKEVAVTGIDWVFAPTLAVVRDDRWGRTYEGYSEDPEVVRQYAGRIVKGLQGCPGTDDLFDESHVIATAKHFIGDGGTERGIDQGDNLASEDELRDIHGQGYVTAIEAGVQTVMATFNSWHGKRVHGHQYLLTAVLKEQMGFDGILVTDWNGFGQVEGCSNQSCALAINAGVDMLMVPEDFRELFANTLAQVRAGEIPQERIDDAVSRILRVKIRAGLFDKGKPSSRRAAGDATVLGSPGHRAVAREAVRESLVLLKNNGNILPLMPNQTILVAGDGANNIGKQCGGWTLSWQGRDTTNADFPGATSIFDGIEAAVAAGGGEAILSEDGTFDSRPDIAIVIFGEDPYAEGQGDRRALSYSGARPADLALLEKFGDQDIPVVSVFLTGRPLWINPELNSSDAFVVAWLPGSEGAGVADVLFRTPAGEVLHEFRGRLTYSWPADSLQTKVNRYDRDYAPLFPYGYGLSSGDTRELGDSLPEIDSATGVRDVTSGLLRIFDGRAIAPFDLFIGDVENWKVPVFGPAATSEASGISVTSIDKDIQEDARRVTWHGNGNAQAYFQASHPLDLSSLTSQEASLVFEAMLHSLPESTVTLRMDGHYPRVSTFDVTEILRELPIGTWQTVSIKLNAFEDTEGLFEEITTPFLISTDGKLDLAVADIHIDAS